MTQSRIVCSEGSNLPRQRPRATPAPHQLDHMLPYSGGYRPLLSVMVHLPGWPEGNVSVIAGATPASPYEERLARMYFVSVARLPALPVSEV